MVALGPFEKLTLYCLMKQGIDVMVGLFKLFYNINFNLCIMAFPYTGSPKTYTQFK